MTSPTPPRGSWFRFSLRALLLIVTASAIGLFAGSWAKPRQELVAEIVSGPACIPAYLAYRLFAPSREVVRVMFVVGTSAVYGSYAWILIVKQGRRSLIAVALFHATGASVTWMLDHFLP